MNRIWRVCCVSLQCSFQIEGSLPSGGFVQHRSLCAVAVLRRERLKQASRHLRTRCNVEERDSVREGRQGHTHDDGDEQTDESAAAVLVELLKEYDASHLTAGSGKTAAAAASVKSIQFRKKKEQSCAVEFRVVLRVVAIAPLKNPIRLQSNNNSAGW